MNPIYTHISNQLKKLTSSNSFRQLPAITAFSGNFIDINGRRLLNLSSNDYLGIASDMEFLKHYMQLFSSTFLTHNPLTKCNEVICFNKKIIFDDDEKQDSLPLLEMIDKGLFQYQYIPMSSSSSRLISGNHPLYTELENRLALAYNRQSALVFCSGYHANLGVITSLARNDCVIFSDKLNHASIVDAIVLSRAKFYRYKHCDLNHLEGLLKSHRSEAKYAIIVSESVFSMDGDIADLQTLVRFKQDYDCLLIVDEAHAVGVFGNNGLGISEKYGLIQQIDIIIGTFGKALAGLGAFVICDNVFRDYFINNARTFIFTTALPPAQLHWQIYVLNAVMQMQDRRRHLHELSNLFRWRLMELGYKVTGNSQIIAVIIGSNEATINEAQKWQDSGLYVIAIRPPTVPANTARLRISLRADIDVTHLPFSAF